jgi:hypothetical protein
VDIRTIPLRTLLQDPEKVLTESADSGVPVVVELPDHRRVALQPLAPEGPDDLLDVLIESNADFRAVLEASKASPREPFPG